MLYDINDDINDGGQWLNAYDNNAYDIWTRYKRRDTHLGAT